MKIIMTVLISAAVFFTLQRIIPTEEEYGIYSSTVRLHVIANSDTEADQSLKLKVRDAVLENVNNLQPSSREEALSQIEERKEEIESIAKTVIKNEGYDYDVNIEVGEEMYPTRYYEDFALPAGKYTSVRVMIGEGEGQNWWCVLYPPLCTSSCIEYEEEAKEVGLTKNQYNLITSNESGEYKIKFKLLEIASEAFGFKYE